MLRDGEMSERFKELVLKTSDSERSRGFESHSLRQIFLRIEFNTLTEPRLEKYSSGRRGAPAKGVGRVTVARVQIPLSPPYRNGLCSIQNPQPYGWGFLLLLRHLSFWAKSHAAHSLFACKRAHGASACHQLFAGCVDGTWHLFSPTDISEKAYKACSDFFKWSERTRTALCRPKGAR